FALGLAARAHARLGHRGAAAAALQQAIALTEHDGSREEYGTVLGSAGAALLLLEESDAAATVLAAAEHVLGAEFLYLSLGVEPRQIDGRLRARLRGAAPPRAGAPPHAEPRPPPPPARGPRGPATAPPPRPPISLTCRPSAACSSSSASPASAAAC